MAKVLVVEPDPIYRKLFRIWIRDHFGAAATEVAAVGDAAEAEAVAERLHPNVLLTAFELEGKTDGLHLARRLHAAVGDLRVILIAQTTYARLRKRLSRLPRTQFLAKPVGESTFVEVVGSALQSPLRART